MIRDETPDVIGVQEARHGQAADLWASLPDYEFFGSRPRRRQTRRANMRESFSAGTASRRIRRTAARSGSPTRRKSRVRKPGATKSRASPRGCGWWTARPSADSMSSTRTGITATRDRASRRRMLLARRIDDRKSPDRAGGSVRRLQRRGEQPGRGPTRFRSRSHRYLPDPAPGRAQPHDAALLERTRARALSRWITSSSAEVPRCSTPQSATATSRWFPITSRSPRGWRFREKFC